MLKITPVEYFPEHDVSAYTDDTRWWVRYLIPGHVSIRRDANGHPVFQLLEYAFSDDDRERDPDLPAGGGSMTMDVELKVDKVAEDAIRAKLQEEVDATWQRLKAAADAAAKPVQGARLNAWFRGQGPFGDQDVTFGLGTDTPESPPGDRPPQVVFAHPTWTEGTFKLSAPQSEALISHRVAEGPLSLVGNEVASASFDLTAAGATLIRKTLTNPDGTGATDLVPIQAEFQMKFLARIPPVKVMATADSSSLYTSIQSIYHDYEGGGVCDEDSFVHFEHHLETAEQSGLITVKLDTGTLELTDDLVQQLRSDALKTVQDLIKDRMFEKRPAPPAPADDKTKDFVSSHSDVYYLKSSYDASSMHVGYTEELQSVKAWPVNPQGTLQAFLAGVPAAEMSRYLRLMDLSDSLFESLQLEVTVFADWADEPISFVDCQLKYSGIDENNQQVDKFETLTFTKDHTSEAWDPSLIGSKRQYSYRWRIGFTGREPGEFSDWQEETSPRLNLTVADPGKVAVKVLAGNVNFAQTTRQVQVDLEYAAPGVDPETATLVLNSGQQEQQYQRYIYTAWDRPVRYRTRFFLQNDQTLESDWGSTTSRQLVINEPPSNRKLDVQLVPVGDWTDVAQTVVDLRYGADGDAAEGVYVLKGTDEFRSWMVVLKDPTKRKFSYKVLTSFKDGSPPATSGWQEAESDQSLPILVKRSPHLSVNLLGELVNFDDTPIVMVKLGYHDEVGGIHNSQTFPLRKGAEPATWSFPIADDRRRSYLQQITYNTADGDVVKLAEEANDATAIAVPKLKVPEVSCLVVPRPVDFVQTPVVELTIDYSDPVNGIEASETLVFVEPTPQSFRVQVEEDSPREFQVTTTYYLADGTTFTRDPVTLDKTKIVVPKYVPAA